jgi:hypothetical protein
MSDLTCPTCSDRIIKAAQIYDETHKPKSRGWTRVPDEQVRRLLLGAIEEMSKQSFTAVLSQP